MNKRRNSLLLQTVFFILCDFQSVTLRRCVTNKPPAMRVRIEGYTKKLQSRYNKGVQAYHIAKGEKIWLKKLIVYHIQNGCVNTTLFLHLSIDGKLSIINIGKVWEKYFVDCVVIKE